MNGITFCIHFIADIVKVYDTIRYHSYSFFVIFYLYSFFYSFCCSFPQLVTYFYPTPCISKTKICIDNML